MNYAEVVMSLANKQIDRGFHYRIPEHLRGIVDVGKRVAVPFGGGNKKTEGYVVALCETVDFDESKIKDITEVTDDFRLFTSELILLAYWMKEKYYTTLSACLQAIMPKGIKMKSDYIATTLQGAAAKLSKKENEIFDYINANENRVAENELKEIFGNTLPRYLKQMKEKGCLDIQEISETTDYSIRIKQARINEEKENIEDELEEICEKDTPQARVIKLLRENGQLPLADIKAYLSVSDSPIKTLEKNELIIIDTRIARRSPFGNRNYEKTEAPMLTEEQNIAVGHIRARLGGGAGKPILLHGITGSGKTEVYIQAIESVLQAGKQAIVLVPEIALTPQAVEKFIGRFGAKVSVTHSRLSLGERFDQWKKAFDGEVSIMIGPRSAVFTPFQNLGIIIMDEEHEATYQSETTPKYNTKQVAEKRSELSGALLLLGSATPSVDTFYETQEGAAELIQMKERVNRKRPEIHVIDMREELSNANLSMFSEALSQAVKEAISKNEQVILFLNRRGFSTFVSCRKCGYVMKCDDCNVNYTYHAATNKLICHYCGREQKNPKLCPVCASKYIRYFGIGTQKLEEETAKLFSEARILRMDMDTTGKKDSHERIISDFANHKADILLGTQMIAKGLDFPKVSVVGIIAADLAINQGDYRSAETAYQLLTQVSGRAGRALADGSVYIQTYNPEHYSIRFTQRDSYEDFYRHEITVRRQMNYPPFSHIFSVLFSGESEKKLIVTLNRLLDIMKHYNRKTQFEILGPAPAFISKIRRKYRWKLYVKGEDEDRLKNFVIYCVDKLSMIDDVSGITMNLTLNPSHMD